MLHSAQIFMNKRIHTSRPETIFSPNSSVSFEEFNEIQKDYVDAIAEVWSRAEHTDPTSKHFLNAAITESPKALANLFMQVASGIPTPFSEIFIGFGERLLGEKLRRLRIHSSAKKGIASHIMREFTLPDDGERLSKKERFKQKMLLQKPISELNLYFFGYRKRRDYVGDTFSEHAESIFADVQKFS